MVKHPWERHEDFKAALLAAREALDAAERAESVYYETVCKTESKVAWLYEQSREALIRRKERVMNEFYEATCHLKDALRAWWDVPTDGWHDARMPGPWDAA
jgi:antibiotic biosynthesis monooxygenase (ABM) superfamily enzyme